MTTILELPDDLLSSARMSLDELRTELAITLYASRRLSIGKARELAQMPLWQFRQLLASRRIPVNLTPDDLDQEISTLQQLGRS
jgi:predicted HTH domain antitoxin